MDEQEPAQWMSFITAAHTGARKLYAKSAIIIIRQDVQVVWQLLVLQLLVSTTSFLLHAYASKVIAAVPSLAFVSFLLLPSFSS